MSYWASKNSTKRDVTEHGAFEQPAGRGLGVPCLQSKGSRGILPLAQVGERPGCQTHGAAPKAGRPWRNEPC